MILRVRLGDGAVRRVSVSDGSLPTEFVSAVKGLTWDRGRVTNLYMDPQFKVPVTDLALALKSATSGDMFYVKESKPCLDLDIRLFNASGKIVRSKHPILCLHPLNGMCEHCAPLSPYDPQYHQDQGIKHLSFHAYLKRLYDRSGTDKLLEEPIYQMDQPCKNHPPYPQGSCSSCAPLSVALKRQEYRMVDHVEIADGKMVDRFLDKWRDSGKQAVGYLFGYYDSYSNVPLGIKAVVRLIVEPMQQGYIDGFELLCDHPCFDIVDQLVSQTASQFGLELVGIIYTDLITSKQTTGQSHQVVQTRTSRTSFISCYEAVFLAQEQNRHVYNCPWSKTHQFGSRFVTLIATGNSSGNIDLFACQISLQGSILVKADLIQPTTDPSLLCVKTPCPEILYSRSENGRAISCKANPNFPVDYLVVTLTHGFLSTELPMFSDPRTGFAFISNFKLSSGPEVSVPFVRAMARHFEDRDPSILLLDWWWVVGLYALRTFVEDDPSFFPVLKQFLSDPTLLDKVLDTRGWKSYVSLFEASIQSESWACTRCTFINTLDRSSCEICDLPKSI